MAEDVELPSKVDLDLLFPRDADVAALLGLVGTHVFDAPGPAAGSWFVPRDAMRDPPLQRPGTPDPSAAADCEEGVTAIGDDLLVRIEPFDPRSSPERAEEIGLDHGWFLHVRSRALGSASRLPELIAARAALARAALEQGALDARLSRFAEGELTPLPPEGAPELLLATPREADIAEAYAAPGVYWDAWETAEPLPDGRRLVTRCLATEDETLFKRAVIEPTLDMARAAHPGRTEWPPADLTERERRMIDDMPHYLRPIGYDPDAKSVEFSAVVPEDDHLGPADYILILDYLSGMAEEPVEEVCVTFLNRAMAEREAPGLRDTGAVIQFMQDGALTRL